MKPGDSKKKIKLEGVIEETLPGTKFKVKINIGGIEKIVDGYISGKMRMHYIRLQVGDKVDLEISPYDVSKARIIYRH